MIARIVTYTVIVILGLFVFFTTFVLDHGGSRAQPDPGPAEGVTTIHDLSIAPDMYKGQTVTTQGTLGFSFETSQYQLVDEGQAVVVKNYEVEALNALSGQEVLVTGVFDYEDRTGVLIDAETIQVLD
jgi:hypothetical protein